MPSKKKAKPPVSKSNYAEKRKVRGKLKRQVESARKEGLKQMIRKRLKNLNAIIAEINEELHQVYENLGWYYKP
jgi:hypothetical protein